jgi:hypothetical protein
LGSVNGIFREYSIPLTSCCTVNTSLDTIYEPIFSEKVWAGIGEFQGAYVYPYIHAFQSSDPQYNLSLVPYTNMAPAYNLLANPLYSTVVDPIDCDERSCDSYLLTGGMSLMRPWQPTNYTDNPVILLRSISGTQLEFSHGIQEGDYIEESDCDLFYQDGFKIAVRFCVGPSRVRTGSFIAGKNHSPKLLLFEILRDQVYLFVMAHLVVLPVSRKPTRRI